MRFSAVNVFPTTLLVFGNLAAAKPAAPAKGPAKASTKGGATTKPQELAAHGPNCHQDEDCDYMYGKGNCYRDIGTAILQWGRALRLPVISQDFDLLQSAFYG